MVEIPKTLRQEHLRTENDQRYLRRRDFFGFKFTTYSLKSLLSQPNKNFELLATLKKFELYERNPTRIFPILKYNRISMKYIPTIVKIGSSGNRSKVKTE